MKKLLIAAALILAATVLTAALTACEKTEHTLPDAQRQSIEKQFTKYLSRASGAVYAVYKGEPVFDGGSGMATKDVKNSTDVAYGVASITKQFTASCIMKLSEEGKLSTDDKLSTYYPEYAHGDEITIKNLLTLRSGIPDYEIYYIDGKVRAVCMGDDSLGVELPDENTAEQNVELIRSYFFSRELLFKPGAYFDYSDSDYALLAGIVAQVSGMSYHDYVRENIFKPLGMEHTAFIDDNDLPESVVLADSDHSDFGTDYYTTKGTEYGCGDILSTPRDMYLWYKGLFGGQVVSEASLKLMTKNYSSKGELGYGYGLMISDSDDCKTPYHYGMIPTYYSAVFYVPEIDYFQILLSNRDSGGPQGIAAQMAMYFGETVGVKIEGII